MRKRPWSCIGLIAICIIVPAEQYALSTITQLQPSINPSSEVQFTHGRKNWMFHWGGILSSRYGWMRPHSDPLFLTSSDTVESDPTDSWNSTEALNEEITRLSQLQRWNEAYSLIQSAENRKQKTSILPLAQPNRDSYSILLRAIAASVVDKDTIKLAESVFHHLISSEGKMAPTRVEFSAILLALSKSYDHRAADRCEFILEEHWRRYNATISNSIDFSGAEEFCPTYSSYVATMTAISRSGGGLRAAQRAEALLEEMERFSKTCRRLKHLKPTTTCVNIVLYVL